jgi:nicotinamidase-related amidase
LENFPGAKEMKAFVKDNWDAAVVDELKPDVEGGEVVVDKIRQNGFWGSECPLFPFAHVPNMRQVAPVNVGLADSVIQKLRDELRSRGIDHLVVVGVATNMCVESTIRASHDEGWHMTTVSDATATLTQEAHEASLLNLAYFGNVATVAEVEEALKQW